MSQEYSVNNIGGYIRYRREHWAADRFVAILIVQSGTRRRPSKREFSRAADAMKYGRQVTARLARMKTLPAPIQRSRLRRFFHWLAMAYRGIVANCLARWMGAR